MQLNSHLWNNINNNIYYYNNNYIYIYIYIYNNNNDNNNKYLLEESCTFFSYKVFQLNYIVISSKGLQIKTNIFSMLSHDKIYTT